MIGPWSIMPPVFRTIDNFLEARPHWQINLCGLTLISLFGILDHFTGFELSFSVFYLIPIVLTAWYVGRQAALVMSLISALTWFAADYTSGHSYSQAWMPFWNATARLVFFFVITYLTGEIKLRLQVERQSARTDLLTGVKNSLAFKEEADLLFKTAKRYRYPVTVGFIDLDDFKSVNDKQGHAEGDRALKAVGATLSLSARESDIVARLGGDEFAMVLSHTDISGARTFFDRLHGRLLWAMREGSWPIGFSIGVAVLTDGVPNYSEALKSADTLMYRVKNGSRNNVIYEVFPGAEAGVQQSASPDAPTAARW
jgi:diguanylate cyclase (GGDEF)-like protein